MTLSISKTRTDPLQTWLAWALPLSIAIGFGLGASAAILLGEVPEAAALSLATTLCVFVACGTIKIVAAALQALSGLGILILIGRVMR